MNATRPLVLIFDDDAANRCVKARSLQMGGMQVLEAEDGTTALTLIAEQQPSLVLLDVNLPDVTGLEVSRRIKLSWPEIIVIGISATTNSSAEEIAGLESGADCYLTTPVEPLESIRDQPVDWKGKTAPPGREIREFARNTPLFRFGVGYNSLK